MKVVALLALAVLLNSSAFAGKPCEELKAEIEAKLDAKGVRDYTLEVVPSDQIAEKKVVGSCDGGTKKIVYTKK
jgi:hypothetical protein